MRRLELPVVCVLAALFSTASLPDLEAAGFIRGDVDRNGKLEITDPIKLLGNLFLGDIAIACSDAADANDSGKLDISDSIYVLSYLFLGAPPPLAPFPSPGQDLTADSLDCGTGIDQVRRWNQIAVDASGLDHMNFREQMGPGRSSRALAMVQIAVFEAVNAIVGGYESYVALAPASASASLDAAVAQAAHDTLVVLFPSQAAAFDALLAEDLLAVEEGTDKVNGVDAGLRAAAAILVMRAGDGSAHPESLVGIDYITSDLPGKWRQDPISLHPMAMGARWAEVTPFVLESAAQFRVPPPPALDSPEYAAAYNEVKRLGGDGSTTPTERTEEGTNIGIYWAYDGMPSLCAPPRLYNQIALTIADQMGSDAVEVARLLAHVNVAMADAGIAIWESKYHYNYWRPVTGIREADAGTGPTGAGDGNPGTAGDPTYSPLGAPASNVNGPNFTPPFPAYPSGHAGFGGALFQILRRFYGSDDMTFTFMSDELNGVTRDNQGNERALLLRTFQSFSEAEEENGQSRIYLGIHWSFDKTEGITQGRLVANLVFDNLFQPLQ